MNYQDKILTIITDYYLNSRDFNGCPYYFISENIKIENGDLIEELKNLITDEKINLITSKEEMNPHIIRTGFLPMPKQIENLLTLDNSHTKCFYPHENHLKLVIDKSAFFNEPYKLELALGAPQLHYRSFDLSILEMYRNDPRYYYKSNDIGGSIGIKDEFYESDSMNESDKILLQAFGFSINENHNRAVAVFLSDLSKLSFEHQQIWKAKELDDSFQMHPGFYNSQVLGIWPKGVSLFDAILKEIYLINQLCGIIKWPKLFKRDFGEYGEEKPKLFAFLIRPTLKEFYDFILVFDKVLSDNLNISFFKIEMNLEIETIRNDGKIVISQKGTIQLLDEWMRKNYTFQDDTGWRKSIQTLRKVRKLRQTPAHKLESDSFDNKYIIEQREIAIDVYNAISFIRMLFQKHPEVLKVKFSIPEWLENGKIYIN